MRNTPVNHATSPTGVNPVPAGVEMSTSLRTAIRKHMPLFLNIIKWDLRVADQTQV
jgi:hypothetical protein